MKTHTELLVDIFLFYLSISHVSHTQNSPLSLSLALFSTTSTLCIFFALSLYNNHTHCVYSFVYLHKNLDGICVYNFCFHSRAPLFKKRSQRSPRLLTSTKNFLFKKFSFQIKISIDSYL